MKIKVKYVKSEQKVKVNRQDRPKKWGIARVAQAPSSDFPGRYE